jgi:hypothetical protein
MTKSGGGIERGGEGGRDEGMVGPRRDGERIASGTA